MSSTLHAHAPVGPAELIEVADRVFAYVQPDGSWWINNTGFVVGSKAVVSVDACSTHDHGDHTFGNSLFGQATIVAHELCRTELLRSGPPPQPGVWEPVEWGPVE